MSNRSTSPLTARSSSPPPLLSSSAAKSPVTNAPIAISASPRTSIITQPPSSASSASKPTGSTNNYLLHTLKTKVNKQEEAMDTQNKTISQLEEEVKALTSQLAIERRKTNEYSTTNNKLNTEINELNDKVDKQQREITSLKKEIINKVVSHQDQLALKEKEIIELSRSIKNVSSSMLTNHSTIELLERQVKDHAVAVEKEKTLRRKDEEKYSSIQSLSEEFAQYRDEEEKKMRFKNIEIQHLSKQISLNVNYKQKAEEYLTSWETERNRFKRRLNRAIETVETLKMDINSYKLLLKHITISAFVNQWRLRKQLRGLFEKAIELSTRSLIEQTEMVPSLGSSIQLQTLSDLPLRITKALHSYPWAIGTRYPMIVLAKYIDNELSLLQETTSIIYKQKHRWADTAQSFFLRNVEITNESSNNNFALMQAQTRANQLRHQAAALVDKYELLERKLLAVSEAYEANRAELELLKKAETNEIKEKKMENNILFERSIDLRRRCQQLSKNNVMLEKYQERLIEKNNRLKEDYNQLNKEMGEIRLIENKFILTQRDTLTGREGLGMGLNNNNNNHSASSTNLSNTLPLLQSGDREREGEEKERDVPRPYTAAARSSSPSRSASTSRAARLAAGLSSSTTKHWIKNNNPPKKKENEWINKEEEEEERERERERGQAQDSHRSAYSSPSRPSTSSSPLRPATATSPFSPYSPSATSSLPPPPPTRSSYAMPNPYSFLVQQQNATQIEYERFQREKRKKKQLNEKLLDIAVNNALKKGVHGGKHYSAIAVMKGKGLNGRGGDGRERERENKRRSNGTGNQRDKNDGGREENGRGDGDGSYPTPTSSANNPHPDETKAKGNDEEGKKVEREEEEDDYGEEMSFEEEYSQISSVHRPVPAGGEEEEPEPELERYNGGEGEGGEYNDNYDESPHISPVRSHSPSLAVSTKDH